MTHDLHLGDGLGVMASFPSDSIDMILVDTPFGTTKNPWDKMLDLDEMWAQSCRVIKPGGAIVHFATNPYAAILIMSHLKGYKHKWVWSKKQSGNFAVAKHMPMSVDEDILVFTARGERPNYNPIMRKGKMRHRGSKNSAHHGRGFGGMKQVYYQSDEYYPTSILEFAAVARRQSLFPSQKPVALLTYLIQTYTNPGDIVLDFCMGSGSTVVAAVECGRHGIGIESSPDIYAIAESRFVKETA